MGKNISTELVQLRINLHQSSGRNVLSELVQSCIINITKMGKNVSTELVQLRINLHHSSGQNVSSELVQLCIN